MPIYIMTCFGQGLPFLPIFTSWSDSSWWFWFTFPVTTDAVCLSRYLLAICLPSLQKYLFSFYDHFKFNICFLLPSFMTCLYILDVNLLLGIWFVNTSSHSTGCLLTLLTVSFVVKTLAWCNPTCVFLFSLSLYFYLYCSTWCLIALRNT
jgi:hypothetical protein